MVDPSDAQPDIIGTDLHEVAERILGADR